MPRNAFRRSSLRRQPDQSWLLLAGINLILAVILGIFLLKPHPSPAIYGMVKKAMENLESSPAYPLDIYENAGSFTLSFEGEVKRGIVTGKIYDYNLEVFLQGDKLYIRKEGETDWEESNRVEMEGLTAFLKTPRSIFNMLGRSITGVKSGPDKSYAGEIYKTVYWNVDNPDFWLSLFPEIDTSLISEGSLTANIASDNFFIRRIMISLKMNLPDGETREITRTLSIKEYGI